MSLDPVALKLQGRGGWLRLGTLLVAVRAFWGVLHHLDVTLSGEPRGSIEWEINAPGKNLARRSSFSLATWKDAAQGLHERDSKDGAGRRPYHQPFRRATLPGLLTKRSK